MQEAFRLTPGEFELMDILWSLGDASVKEVWQKVSRKRPIAYTTVMTVLDKMRRKGALRQSKRGKAYFYTPIFGRDDVLRQVVDNVIDVYFAGSEENLHDFLDQAGPDVSARSQAPREPDLRPGPALPEDESDGPSLEEFLL